jgi:DHA1 family multidrug resistance protein-like MFS transporter
LSLLSTSNFPLSTFGGRNLFAITAAAFVGFTGFTLVMPFLALYIQELGATNRADVAFWTGITLGITPAITALCNPFWGRVGDRFGNKLLVQRSLLGGLVIMTAMAFATRPWHLFALRAVQGLIAGYGPLTLAMAALSAPPERMARAIATVQTAQRMGPAIGPVLGGILASVVGLRNVFFVSAGVYSLASLIMGFLYVEPRPRGAAAAGPDRTSFGDILALENFVLLLMVIFGLQLVDKSFGPVLLLYLNQLGYGAEQSAVLAGLLFSVLAVSGAFGNQLAATLLKRMTPRNVIDSAVLTAAAALAIFAFAGTSWLLLLSILVFGASVGTANTASFTAAGSVIPRHVHGASFGLLSSASLIGFAVSPILSGLVASRSIRAVFLSGVVALALLAVVVRRVMVERSREVEPPPTEEA